MGDHHHVDAGIENRHRNAAVMDSLTAFAAIELTAVAWDGSLTPTGGDGPSAMLSITARPTATCVSNIWLIL